MLVLLLLSSFWVSQEVMASATTAVGVWCYCCVDWSEDHGVWKTEWRECMA